MGSESSFMPVGSAATARSNCKLRIFAIEEEGEGRDRALAIIDALAAKRAVVGSGPWVASYPAASAAEVFSSCADELEAIDPRWVEVLDFVGIPAQPSSDREPGRSRLG